MSVVVRGSNDYLDHLTPINNGCIVYSSTKQMTEPIRKCGWLMVARIKLDYNDLDKL